MYDVDLSDSWFRAQTDETVWETTVGQLLRDIAGSNPSGSALVEVTTDGQGARRWTYRELLGDSERLTHLRHAISPASALSFGHRTFPNGS